MCLSLFVACFGLRFQVLSATRIKITVFGDVTSINLFIYLTFFLGVPSMYNTLAYTVFYTCNQKVT